MPRHGTPSNSHLSWLEPASSSGGLSPMQLLVVWLSRHYAAYSISSTKAGLLEELRQGMHSAGYPDCTVHALRSKIDGLKREARREQLGDHRHSRAFEQNQSSLMSIFATEGEPGRELDTSDTETSDENGSSANQEGRGATGSQTTEQHDVKREPRIQDGSRNAPFVVIEAAESGDQGAGARRQRMATSLDEIEIRRRFELLCARHDLEQRGVTVEIINQLLPLPEE